MAIAASLAAILTSGLAVPASTVAGIDKKPAHKQAWQWRWQVWLPPHWQRLAKCETGLNWRHNSGTYQGAFGFHRDSWDDRRYRPRGYPSEAYNATPWQQWKVARKIAKLYGLADPWGCWRGPEHAWVRGGLPEHGQHS